MSPAGPEAHIDELWMRMRPLAASRVEVLDRTLAAVVAGHYDEQVIADGPPAASTGRLTRQGECAWETDQRSAGRCVR